MDPLQTNLLTEETRSKRTWKARALAGLLLVGVGFVGIAPCFYPSSNAPSSATLLGGVSRPYHWAPTSSATNPDTISNAAVAGVQPNFNNQNIYVCRATAVGHYTFPGKAVHGNDNQCCFADSEKEWCEDKYDLLVGAGPFNWRPTSSATNPDTISNAVVAGVQPNFNNQNIYVCRATAAGHYTFPGKAVHGNDNQCCFADSGTEWCEDNYDILITA